jgi:Glycosyltransferase family 87
MKSTQDPVQPLRDPLGSAGSTPPDARPVRGSSAAKKSPLRMLAAGCILGAGILCVIGAYMAGLTNQSATERDYIEYWAAGQQVVHGSNPYDVAGVLRAERAVGYASHQPIITPSPPIILILCLPLGFVSVKTGLILWMIAILACLAASIFVLWAMNGCPDNPFHLFGFLFPPAVACLMAGQLGVFLLLGVVLFLRFQRTQPFLAGAALLLCVVKPHLFLPFACALALFIAGRKVYGILAGFAAALVASCALTFCFGRHIWGQYLALGHNARILPLFVPTLSVALRFAVTRGHIWVQFVPEAAACVWAVWFYWTRRTRWDWMDHGLLVLLVSMMSTPYGWFTDEAILLPAILAGAYRANHAGRSLIPLCVIAGAALVEVFAPAQLTSPDYLWTTPAWLGWYLYATRNSRPKEQETAMV